MWATCNIGANNQTEEGLYFAWGEISGVPSSQYYYEESGRRTYNSFTYKFYDGVGGYTKYNDNDGLMYLQPEDDAAYQLWGNEWKIPCHGQYYELIHNTDIQYDNELDDYVFVSRTNSNIKLYIPNSGVIHGDTLNSGDDDVTKCFTLNTTGFSLGNQSSCVYAANFSGDWMNSYSIYKYFALPIRPVRIKNNQGEIIENWYVHD